MSRTVNRRSSSRRASGNLQPQQHHLKLAELGDVRVRVYAASPEDTDQVVAIIAGKPEDGCLVRLQSSCLYGEAFSSRDCDCHDQLREAISLIKSDGVGILIHLDQEGRGSGLEIKAAAYRLVEQTGLDTFEAYERLGVPRDRRDYAAAARVLLSLDVRRIRLMTNNPRKIDSLMEHGIDVVRVPLIADPDPARVAYMAAKRRMGHLL